MTRAESKQTLRRKLRALRTRLASEAPDAARQAALALPLSDLPPGASFAAYHPLGSEMDPGPLVQRLRDAGLKFALPVCLAPDQPLVFRLYEGPDTLVPDVIGIPGPAPNAPVIQPDLVITPLLAFDRQGGRLGQGGGFYDRTLAALRAQKTVLVLGLAYAGQEVPALDLEPHDQRMDAILTETGYNLLKSGQTGLRGQTCD